VERRNQRLREFFEANDMQVRIIGDENKPMILYLDSLVLPCYVKNFDLVFDDSLLDGESGGELRRFRLRSEPTTGPDVTEFLQSVKSMKMRRAYRIKSGELFLHDWKNRNMNREPVFAPDNSKIYLSLGRAKQTAKEINALGIECEVI